MSSDEAYDVRHPEMALLTHTDILVGADESEDSVPANLRICSLLHMETIAHGSRSLHRASFVKSPRTATRNP